MEYTSKATSRAGMRNTRLSRSFTPYLPLIVNFFQDETSSTAMRITLSLLTLSAIVTALPAPQPNAVTLRGNVDVDATYPTNNWRKVIRDAADVDATYTANNWGQSKAARE